MVAIVVAAAAAPMAARPTTRPQQRRPQHARTSAAQEHDNNKCVYLAEGQNYLHTAGSRLSTRSSGPHRRRLPSSSPTLTTELGAGNQLIQQVNNSLAHTDTIKCCPFICPPGRPAGRPESSAVHLRQIPFRIGSSI